MAKCNEGIEREIIHAGEVTEVMGFGHFHIETMSDKHIWLNLGGTHYKIVPGRNKGTFRMEQYQ